MGGSLSSQPQKDDSLTTSSANNVSNNSSATLPPKEENTNTNACAAFALPPPIASPLKRSPSQEFLDETIADHPVVIFSKTTCGYCDKAKSVFDALGVGYKTVELDSRADCSDLQDDLKRMTGARTVPRVFVDGQCIGGGSDTISMFKQGSLQKLLKRKNIECPKCDETTTVD